MKNISQLRNEILIIILFFIIYSCQTQKGSIQKYCNYNKVYLELLKESGINTTKINKKKLNCTIQNITSDSSFVQQHYSEEIYLEGTILKGNKVGVWKGYYKGKLLFKVGYLGESKNRPIFIEIWSIDGKHIRQTNLSIIE